MNRSTALSIKRPGLLLLGSEPWRAAREYVAHKVGPEIPRTGGDGHPVVLFPGLGTNDSALAPLSARCRALADHTHVGWVFRLLSGAELQFDASLSARLRTPPPVPTPSIYSRADGIVAWQTCLHEEAAPQVEDVEIDGSDTGMGWNRAVLALVADRLAQPVGSWRPYSR